MRCFSNPGSDVGSIDSKDGNKLRKIKTMSELMSKTNLDLIRSVNAIKEVNISKIVKNSVQNIGTSILI